MMRQKAETNGDTRSPIRLAFQHMVRRPPESFWKIDGYKLRSSVVDVMKSKSTTSMLGKSNKAD